MKIKYLIAIVFAITAFAACTKDDNFNYPEGTVGISKIIYFPSVTINGDRLIILKEGDTYTDPGVVATLNGAPVDVTTTGTVNTAVPGVYDLAYTAANEQGYTATDWRTVVVIGNDVSANDLSGTYLRPLTGITSTWTKISDGVYSVENPGGSSGVGMTVIAVNYTDDQIKIPHQISPDFGEVSSQDESYDGSVDPATYSWVFIAGGYGTSLRTFTKQ